MYSLNNKGGLTKQKKKKMNLVNYLWVQTHFYQKKKLDYEHFASSNFVNSFGTRHQFNIVAVNIKGCNVLTVL